MTARRVEAPFEGSARAAVLAISEEWAAPETWGAIARAGGPMSSFHVLAALDLPGDEAIWTQELHDAIAQLEKQLLQQRVGELQAKQRLHGLDDTDKYELRELLKALASMR